MDMGAIKMIGGLGTRYYLNCCSGEVTQNKLGPRKGKWDASCHSPGLLGIVRRQNNEYSLLNYNMAGCVMQRQERHFSLNSACCEIVDDGKKANRI